MSDPVARGPGSPPHNPAPTNGATSEGPSPDRAARPDHGAPVASGQGTSAAFEAAPISAPPPPPAARPRGRWLTLLLVVVGVGLGLGVLAAALSAPLRGSGRIVATSLPGAAGGAARGAAGGDPAGADGAAPGGGAAQGQNPGGAGGQAGGPGGAGRAGN